MKNPVPIPVIEFLSRIVQEHVKAYQTDFDYDTVILTKAIQKPAEQDRTFYWMGRECGTWCFKERDVFLCDKADFLYTAPIAADVQFEDRVYRFLRNDMGWLCFTRIDKPLLNLKDRPVVEN